MVEIEEFGCEKSLNIFMSTSEHAILSLPIPHTELYIFLNL